MATDNLAFRSFIASPRFDRPILFLFGNDDALVEPAARMIVSAIRKAVGEVDFLNLTASEVASDPSRLFDAFSEVSLFATPSALVISDVTERHAALFSDFLSSLKTGAAASKDPASQIVLFSSSALKAKSKLIGSFRSHPLGQVISCYDVGLERSALRRSLTERGIGDSEDGAVETLEMLSRGLDPVRFDLLLEKLALLVSDGAKLTKADVLACEDGADAEIESDLAILLLSGDRSSLISLFANQNAQSGESTSFLLSLGRSLAGLYSAQTAKSSGRSGGRPLFWRVDKALTAASGRLPNLAQRLERALLDVHQLERRSRSGVGALETIEIERLLLRLSTLFSSPARGGF